jgi:hypothetical protein
LGSWENVTLNREWKYNSKVNEYFIETETTTKLKQKEMEKYREASTSDSRLCFSFIGFGQFPMEKVILFQKLINYLLPAQCP